MSRKLSFPVVVLGLLILAKVGLAAPGVPVNSGMPMVESSMGVSGAASSDAAAAAGDELLASFRSGHGLAFDFIGFAATDKDKDKKCDGDNDSDDKDCKKYCKNKGGQSTAVIDNGKGSCTCVLDGGIIDKKKGTCKCSGKSCPGISR